MAREQVYKSNAERQRAYRQRLKERTPAHIKRMSAELRRLRERLRKAKEAVR